MELLDICWNTRLLQGTLGHFQGTLQGAEGILPANLPIIKTLALRGTCWFVFHSILSCLSTQLGTGRLY